MENSGYGSAHMPSPALVVFSQAGGLGEALRIQRPFHSQVNNSNHSNNNGNHNSSPQAALTEPHLAYLQRAMSFQLPDAKDLHHLSLVGSYGAHLLHGFPPHFLHPAVSSANSGAFGGGGAFVKPFSSGLPLPSAFAPPKCVGLGLDQGMMFGSGSDSFRTTDSSSPACNSLSPPVKEESLEGHTSEEGDRDRICSPAERSPDVPGFRPFPSKQHLVQQQQQQQHPPPQPPTTTAHTIHQQHQIATGQHHQQQQQSLPPNTNGLEPLNLRLDNGSLHHHHHHNYYANNNNNNNNQLNNNNNNNIINNNNNNNNINNNNKYHLSNLFAKRYQQLQQGVGAIKKPQVGTPPPNSCPVCGIQLTINDLEAHFLAELDRLYKLSSAAERHKIRASLSLSGALHPVPPNGIPGPDSRWETFQRIRTNRQSRLRAKTRKRKSESESEFAAQIGNSHCQSCPVCQGRLQRSSEEMAQHVEECLRKSGQSMMQDEDETVDVESYTDDTSNNSAMNMTSHHNLTNNNNNNNNNNNINNNGNGNAILAPTPIITNVTKMDTSPSPLASLQRAAEESTITSLHSTAPWDRKQHHPRIGLSSLNCTATALTAATSISRVTPTSSDQRIDVDFDQDHDNDNHQDADNDNDEEVIVDNTDDEECTKRIRPIEKHDKNNTEEATSSVEIDSATDPSNVKAAVATPDSYVSTSDTSAEPSSRAQVLEELRARIRELEGSPFKTNRNGQDEEHYKCYICKEAYRAPVISTICWHVHCDDCWINLSETKKSCPQCKLVTTTSDLRKIHV